MIGGYDLNWIDEHIYFIPMQGFVLFVTMCREALDDFRRYRRDKEANSQKFKLFSRDGVTEIPSSKIKVGDLIFVEKVPCNFLKSLVFCGKWSNGHKKKYLQFTFLINPEQRVTSLTAHQGLQAFYHSSGHILC